MNCEKCGNKSILATAFITHFDPDQEPYESGVHEKCGYEDGIGAEVSVGIHWCPKCEDIVNVWIEEPMEKTEIKRLQAELKQLKAERNILAMLASDTPKFFNPMSITRAKNLRDKVIGESQPTEPVKKPFNCKHFYIQSLTSIPCAINSKNKHCCILCTDYREE